MNKAVSNPKNRKLQLEIKGLGEYVIPKPSKAVSIGYDLTVPEDVEIPAHSRVIIKLNFAINLPPCYEAKIEPRSGFSAKGIEGEGIEVITKRKWIFFKKKIRRIVKRKFNADVLPGKVAPGYTDSVGVIIKNDDERFFIPKGTRIAQMTIYRTTPVWFVPVAELSCKSRGGGFGSSGTMEIINTPEDGESVG